jgi:ribosomal protein L31
MLKGIPQLRKHPVYRGRKCFITAEGQLDDHSAKRHAQAKRGAES